MFREGAGNYTERVDIIGNKKFLEFVEQLEKDEDLQLETFEVGKDKVQILTIAPDESKLAMDISVPELSPILMRKKTLAEEIALMKVPAPAKPIPMKEEEKDALEFSYEGIDIIEMKKLFEREYKIPAPQTAEEVIGYYARRIAQDVKLPSQFAALVPKVREYLADRAFHQTVDLNTQEMVKAISSNVAGYVTIKSFVKELRKVVVEELEPQLLNAGRLLSSTPSFPWSRLTLKAQKCVLNLVPCGNRYEHRFAKFLEDADDIVRFAKLPDKFGFVIPYTDAMSNLRHYEPDFVAVTADGTHQLIETKGQEDVNVRHKDQAARLWCENATVLTGTVWVYRKIMETEFDTLQPSMFDELEAME
jgi:type III restriction enzyme